MKRSLTLLLILSGLIICVSVNAEWKKEDKKSFSSTTEYQYIFDMANTNYNGMDSISFVEYNAAKANTTPENYAVILKYLGSEIKKNLTECTHKKFTNNRDCPYVVYIHLDEITEKAGMKVTVNTYVDNPDNGQIYKLKVEDGRWNKFDILLQENAKELAKKISSKGEFKKSVIKSVRHDYVDDIYL